jgi:acyl carrier protein
MMTRERFIEDTVAWINKRLLPPGVAVDATTPLFADGLIDSIRILRLIAWTEYSIGRIIPDEEIRMDNFYDVERIADAFLEAAHAHV